MSRLVLNRKTTHRHGKRSTSGLGSKKLIRLLNEAQHQERVKAAKIVFWAAPCEVVTEGRWRKNGSKNLKFTGTRRECVGFIATAKGRAALVLLCHDEEQDIEYPD